MRIGHGGDDRLPMKFLTGLLLTCCGLMGQAELALLGVGPPAMSAQVIGPVQQTSTSNSNTFTLSSPPTLGDALIVECSFLQGSAISSIAGGGITTWIKAISSDVNRDVEVWYGLNSNGSSAVVTVADAERVLWQPFGIRRVPFVRQSN